MINNENLIVLTADDEYRQTKKTLDIEYSTFPAGECYVRIKDVKNIKIFVEVHILSADPTTIMQAILVADAVREHNRKTKIYAMMTYFPYGRQDRVCSEGESNSSEVFFHLVDKYFDEVHTIDMHSSSLRNIWRSSNVKEIPYVFDSRYISLRDFSKVYLKNLGLEGLIVAPDNGAGKRAEKFAEYLGLKNIVFAEKERNSAGISVKLTKEEKKSVKSASSILIADDICDGGGTFIALAECLLEINPEVELNLIITHAIMSKGISKLSEYYSNIYVHDNPYNTKRISSFEPVNNLSHQELI